MIGPQVFAAQTAAEQSYHDAVLGYTVTYPSDWIFKEPDKDGRFFIDSPAGNDHDPFTENVNCSVDPVQENNFTIRSIKAGTIAGIAKAYPSYKAIKTGYVKWNKSEALRLEYTVETKVNDQPIIAHILQNLAIVRGNMYTCTYTAEETSYKVFLSPAKKIIDSLKAG